MRYKELQQFVVRLPVQIDITHTTAISILDPSRREWRFKIVNQHSTVSSLSDAGGRSDDCMLRNGLKVATAAGVAGALAAFAMPCCSGVVEVAARGHQAPKAYLRLNPQAGG
ncbi:hypothetical protein HaLaN_19896 [Haematococcus lacustris]|uniref:Uncharacterized protein n=1 Tax=Haematococcus lacustris TaxID=44745 RepID=A0A6A0A0U3_HAELA|nr:hypothetical protein HaLaN_19896 [Haematococcus lacustris]